MTVKGSVVYWYVMCEVTVLIFFLLPLWTSFSYRCVRIFSHLFLTLCLSWT